MVCIERGAGLPSRDRKFIARKRVVDQDPEGSIDSTNQYFRGIKENPHIYTRAEELEVFQRLFTSQVIIRALVTDGDFFRRNPSLYLPLVRTSFDMFHQAYGELVTHNQRMVLDVASNTHINTPLLDRIQNGNLGLIRAIEGFDLTRGNKFSTYAVPKIRDAIFHPSRNESTPVHIPDKIIDDSMRLNKFRTSYWQSNGSLPDDDVIFEALGLTGEKLAHINYAEQINRGMESLDQPISDRASSQLFGEVRPDPKYDQGHSIEIVAFHGGDDRLEIILDALESIRNSYEKGRRDVAMFLAFHIDSEITVRKLAGEFHCTVSETHGIIRAVHEKLHVYLRGDIHPIVNHESPPVNGGDPPYRSDSPTSTLESLAAIRINTKSKFWERNLTIYWKYKIVGGISLRELGDEYGLGKERVNQIIQFVESKLQEIGYTSPVSV